MFDPYQKTVNVTISVKVNGVEKDITFPVPVTEDNIFTVESTYLKWEEIKND